MTAVTKTKKIDQAIEIFKRHLPTRDSLSKKEFRGAVVADLKKELNITNAGTVGMYFAWSDQLVSGRTAKLYNRTAPRKAKGSVKARLAAQASGAEATDEKLNDLVNEFNKGVAAASNKSVTGKKPSKPALAKNGKLAVQVL